jgi:hypothetical protein
MDGDDPSRGSVFGLISLSCPHKTCSINIRVCVLVNAIISHLIFFVYINYHFM